MYDTPAIVIIENAAHDNEHRIIGPFATGDAASNWAFRNLPVGVLWHWLPIESPATVLMDDFA